MAEPIDFIPAPGSLFEEIHVRISERWNRLKDYSPPSLHAYCYAIEAELRQAERDLAFLCDLRKASGDYGDVTGRIKSIRERGIRQFADLRTARSLILYRLENGLGEEAELKDWGGLSATERNDIEKPYSPRQHDVDKYLLAVCYAVLKPNPHQEADKWPPRWPPGTSFPTLAVAMNEVVDSKAADVTDTIRKGLRRYSRLLDTWGLDWPEDSTPSLVHLVRFAREHAPRFRDQLLEMPAPRKAG